MGLRQLLTPEQPLTPEQLNELADKQYSQKQLTQPEVEIREDPFINPEAEAEIEKNRKILEDKQAAYTLATTPTVPPTPPPADTETKKPLDRAAFYDNLLEEYKTEKGRIADRRNNAAIGDSISNFLGDLYRMKGGEGLATRSNAAGALDEQSKNALDELKTKASLMPDVKNKHTYLSTAAGPLKINNETDEATWLEDPKNLIERRVKRSEGALEETKRSNLEDEEDRDRLDSKQHSSTMKLIESKQQLKEIEEAASPNIKKYLGLYASNKEEAKKFIPYLEKDPEFVRFSLRVGQMAADYRKSISESTITDKERVILDKNIINMTDKPEEFLNKLSELKALADTKLATEMKGYKANGREVSKYENLINEINAKVPLTPEERKVVQQVRLKNKQLTDEQAINAARSTGLIR